MRFGLPRVTRRPAPRRPVFFFLCFFLGFLCLCPVVVVVRRVLVGLVVVEELDGVVVVVPVDVEDDDVEPVEIVDAVDVVVVVEEEDEVEVEVE